MNNIRNDEIDTIVLNVEDDSVHDIIKELSMYRQIIYIKLILINYHTIPSELVLLTNLESLIISGLSSKKDKIFIPDQLYEMVSLERLEITNCTVNYISEKINQLTNLKTINLQGTHILELPEISIELDSLNIEDTFISRLPILDVKEIWVDTVAQIHPSSNITTLMPMHSYKTSKFRSMVRLYDEKRISETKSAKF